jgi:hypothetical protein
MKRFPMSAWATLPPHAHSLVQPTPGTLGTPHLSCQAFFHPLPASASSLSEQKLDRGLTEGLLQQRSRSHAVVEPLKGQAQVLSHRGVGQNPTEKSPSASAARR